MLELAAILRDARTGQRKRAAGGARSSQEVGGSVAYFCGIGGAIFSAGAGGSAGAAPSFFACGSGRAGSGAGVVGRSPPGFDSAGGLFEGEGAGEDCKGGVACASCRSPAAIWTRETTDSANPATINADASSISRL